MIENNNESTNSNENQYQNKHEMNEKNYSKII
jgi:hypothetical protein